MHNKPKYTLFKNTTYALNGFVEITKHESSFKLQLIAFVLFSIVAWVLPFSVVAKVVLQGAMFLPLLAEIANSAIERVVDLVTTEYHEMAKRAKDAGATLVFFTIMLTTFIWVMIIFIELGVIAK
jgi:diacylglycerol kinase (ATP)